MPDYLLEWAYSSSKEQREEILEHMKTNTQSSSLTITDPDQVLKVEAAQHYVKSVTDISTITVPVNQHEGGKIPTAMEWIENARKPTRVIMTGQGENLKFEREADPNSLLADALENMLLNHRNYANCAQCNKVISLANGGRYPRKFCSDACRRRDYRENKKKKNN